MITIDWAHTKDLMVYDGKEIYRVDMNGLLSLLDGHRIVVVEQGAPISLCWSIFRRMARVATEECVSEGLSVAFRHPGLYYISPMEVKEYRNSNRIEKSDEADAIAIFSLAQKLNSLIPVTLDSKEIKLAMFYHLYLRYQKARIYLNNQYKAAQCYFGDICEGQLFGIELAIDQLKPKEETLIKQINELAPGMPKAIKEFKGIGPRIWAGIICVADPSKFSSVNAYLKYCGLINRDSIGNRFNRDARVVYFLLAEQVLKQKVAKWRGIYDSKKADLATANPELPKYQIHNMAMNRLSTALAKEVYNGMR